MLEFAKPLISAAMVGMGLYLAVFGNTWAPRVFAMLPDTELGSWVELFIPFLPMVFIGFGAALFVSSRQ